VKRAKPLLSLFGEYVRKMTASILKSMHDPFEAFNQVRNDDSLLTITRCSTTTKPRSSTTTSPAPCAYCAISSSG
jgi:hypothetical protein